MSSFVGDKKEIQRSGLGKTNENPEIWRIGFLTQKDMSDVGLPEKVAVYLPHSYNHFRLGNYNQFYLYFTSRRNERSKAMKFAVSGGVAGFHSDKMFKAPE